MEQVLQALRTLRKALGLSQDQLSKKIGCSRLSLTYWENNATSPSRDSLERWLKVLYEEVLNLKDREKTIKIYGKER